MSLPLLAAVAALMYLAGKKKPVPAPPVAEKVPGPALSLPRAPLAEEAVFNTRAEDDEDAVQPLQPAFEEPVRNAPPVPKPPVAAPPPEVEDDVSEAVSPPAQSDDVETTVDQVTQADPVAAANELAAYVRANKGKGVALGVKGRPNDTVRALQLQMGEVEADGIYGPATRERGRVLTGRAMPSR